MPQSCFVSLPELRWNSPAFIHYHYSTHPFYTPPQFASPIHPLYSNRLVSGMFGNNYVQRFGIQPVLLQWLAMQCLRSLWFFCLDLENDWAHMTYMTMRVYQTDDLHLYLQGHGYTNLDMVDIIGNKYLVIGKWALRCGGLHLRRVCIQEKKWRNENVRMVSNFQIDLYR